jgi:predicted nucleic acid-binding protein
MKLFLDTNIIIDVIAKRQNQFETSLTILRLCESKQYKGYISALTIPNINYICKKFLSGDGIKSALLTIMRILSVVDLSEKDLIKAFDSSVTDYEDALQELAANNIKADVIITRNIKDYKLSSIQTLTPEEFLRKFKIE